jgi:hypothetical protein
VLSFKAFLWRFEGLVVQSALNHLLDLEAVTGIRWSLTGEFVLNVEAILGRRGVELLWIIIGIRHRLTIPCDPDLISGSQGRRKMA